MSLLLNTAPLLAHESFESKFSIMTNKSFTVWLIIKKAFAINREFKNQIPRQKNATALDTYVERIAYAGIKLIEGGVQIIPFNSFVASCINFDTSC